MSGAPIVITLYDGNNEEISSNTRTIIPWGVMEEAIKLNEVIQKDGLNSESFNALTGLIVTVFDDKFTVEQLKKGADMEQMLTALSTIISRASKLSLFQSNPTMQA